MKKDYHIVVRLEERTWLAVRKEAQRLKRTAHKPLQQHYGELIVKGKK